MDETEYCLHEDCDGELEPGPDDDTLPEELSWMKCQDCGQLYEYDETQEALRVHL